MLDCVLKTILLLEATFFGIGSNFFDMAECRIPCSPPETVGTGPRRISLETNGNMGRLRCPGQTRSEDGVFGGGLTFRVQFGTNARH